MSNNLNELEISAFAARRRKIMDLEQAIFKSRTHTSLEILILIAENHFSAKLSAIYETTKATDASVRQHLRALEQLNFIHQKTDESDGRAKSIVMTEYGQEQLKHYTQELSALMAASTK